MKYHAFFAILSRWQGFGQPDKIQGPIGIVMLKVMSMKQISFKTGTLRRLINVPNRCQVVRVLFGLALVLPIQLSLSSTDRTSSAWAQSAEASVTAPVRSINELATGDEDLQKIAAIVNDHPITEYDIYQRLAFVVSQAGFQLTEADINQMRQQILRSLIDETLKLEEALTFEVSPQRSEINAQLEQIASQSNMTVAQVTDEMKTKNIGIGTLERQIGAEIVWDEIVGGRFGRNVSVTEEEIDAVYQRMVANANKPQYRVFEIQYRVDSPEQEAEVRNGMLNLVNQIRQGTNFQAAAQQISHSASATQGGDIGWVQDGQLPPELNLALRNLKKGEVSPPIRTVSGYYLLLLADRRMIGGADPMKAKVTLQQLVFALPEDTPQDQLQSAGSYLFQASQHIKSCEDLVALKEKFPTATISDQQTMTIGELDEVFQSAVIPLQAGEASAPLLTNQGFHVIGVCDREDVGVNLPDRVQIENQLANQQMTMIARRYLRDLRNDAVVELR